MAEPLEVPIGISAKASGVAETAASLKNMEQVLEKDSRAISKLEAGMKRLGKGGRVAPQDLAQFRSLEAAHKRITERLKEETAAYAKLASESHNAASVKPPAAGGMDVGGVAGQLGGPFSMASMGPIAAAVAAVGMLVSVLKSAVGLAVSFGSKVASAWAFGDAMRYSLSKFLGSAGAAKDALADVMKIANELGLEFQSAAGDFKNLVSAGFSAEQGKELLKLKADLVALGGGAQGATEKIQAAFGHLAKSMAKGKMEGDSFNEILANLPVNKAQILEALAPKLGKSLADMAKIDISKIPVDKLVEAIKEATLKATGASKLGQLAAEGAATTAAGAWEKLKIRAVNFFDEIAAKIGGSEKLAGFINKITKWFDSADAKRLIDDVAKAFEKLGEAISEIDFESVAGGVKLLLAPLHGLVVVLSTLWGYAKRIDDAMTSLGSSFAGIGGGVSSALGALTGLGAAFSSIGSSIVGGLVSSIENGGSAVANAITNLAARAVAAAKAALGIASPSKVFAEIGMQTAEGVAVGARRGMPEVRGAFNELVAPPEGGGGAARGAGGGGSSIVISGDIIIQGVQGAAQIAPSIRAELVRILQGLTPAAVGG